MNESYLMMLYVGIRDCTVSSGGLAVKHPKLGAKGHRFDPNKRFNFFRDKGGR